MPTAEIHFLKKGAFGCWPQGGSGYDTWRGEMLTEGQPASLFWNISCRFHVRKNLFTETFASAVCKMKKAKNPGQLPATLWFSKSGWLHRVFAFVAKGNFLSTLFHALFALFFFANATPSAWHQVSTNDSFKITLYIFYEDLFLYTIYLSTLQVSVRCQFSDRYMRRSISKLALSVQEIFGEIKKNCFHYAQSTPWILMFFGVLWLIHGLKKLFY